MMKFDLKNWLMMMAMASVLFACGGDDEGDPAPEEETDVCVVEGKTTIILTVPENTPETDEIYIVGTFNEWNPGDAAYKLNKRETPANTYCIAVDFDETTMFKFTRGSWESVEKDAECAEVPDRAFDAPDDNSLELEVAKWADIDECG